MVRKRTTIKVAHVYTVRDLPLSRGFPLLNGFAELIPFFFLFSAYHYAIFLTLNQVLSVRSALKG